MIPLGRRLATAIGLALVALGAARAARTAAFLSHAVRARGVIAIASPHPLIGFALPDGRQAQFMQNGFVSRPEGAEVDVLYLPDDALATATAGTFWAVWYSTVWLAGPGAGLIALAVAGGRRKAGDRAAR